MAAPTPVSALVHSSTLVTAGVYVLFRFRNIWLNSPRFGELLIFLGAITIVIAGMRALQETDAKKIVALSTLSQLGFIIMLLGCGNSFIGFFHLLSHAFFKALLFMVVGNIIHLSRRYQDLRKSSVPPWLSLERASIGVIANFSLIGLPFLSGFYSKDIAVERSINLRGGLVFKITFLLGILLTILYSLRFTSILFKLVYMQRVSMSYEKDKFRRVRFYHLLPFSVIGASLALWRLGGSPTRAFIRRSVKFLILLLLLINLIFLMWSLSSRNNFI